MSELDEATVPEPVEDLREIIAIAIERVGGTEEDITVLREDDDPLSSGNDSSVWVIRVSLNANGTKYGFEIGLSEDEENPHKLNPTIENQCTAVAEIIAADAVELDR